MKKKPFVYLFQTWKNYYCYDVNTNSILKLTKENYSLLERAKDIEELSESPMKHLYAQGYFHENKENIILEHPLCDVVQHYLQGNMQQLLLQVTQNCNLRCKYCVYSGSYKNRVHSNKRMDYETAKRAVDFYSEHNKNLQDVRVSFYGGEPLLEMELLKKITAYSQKLFEGRNLRFNLTTNATLLDEEKVEFLMNHNFDIVISLDGPGSVHDRGRVFAEGNKGTFDVIMKRLDMIQKKYPAFLEKIAFNAVLDESNDFVCTSDFFTYDFVKNAMVTSTGVADRDAKEEKTISYAFYVNYNYELFKLFLHYIGKLDTQYVSKLLLSYGQSLKTEIHDSISKPYRRFGKCHPSGPCIAGSQRLFVTVDGDFYPCERVNEQYEVFRIGSLDEGIDKEKVVNLLNVGKITEKECRNCWAVSFCSTCAGDCGNGDHLDRELKLSKCSEARERTERYFKEYCILREYGYEFDSL